MSLNTALIAELKFEAAKTRQLLGSIPSDKLEWRPHQKSMALGKLANHVAELNLWIGQILTTEEFDFATANFNREVPSTTEGILEKADARLAEATAALETATEDALNAVWVVKRGGQEMFRMPKKVALRNFAYNHIYHHRGQISVYLRLLDVPVPGMYGPSADEKF